MIQDIAPHVLHNEYKPVMPKEGDYVLLTAFGAGLTWGSTLIKF